MELAHVGDRRGVEVGHASDHLIAIRMDLERVLIDQFGEAAVRLVLDALPALFLHHAALAHEVLFVDVQRRHAIGFEPQHQRQILRRHRFPEHRRVFGRVGVALAADRRDHRAVRVARHVLAALEHHVLEQVREAGASGLLVLRADVIPELQMDDRRRVILVEDHRQAVRQHRVRVFEFGRTGPRVHRRGRQQPAGEAQTDRQNTARNLRKTHVLPV